MTRLFRNAQRWSETVDGSKGHFYIPHTHKYPLGSSFSIANICLFPHLLDVVPEQRVVVEPHRAVLALDVGLARVLDGDVLEDLVEGEVEPAVRAVLPVVLPVEVRVDLARLVGAKVAAWGKQEQAKFCDLRRGISKAL